MSVILIRLGPDYLIVSFARLDQTQIEPGQRFDGAQSTLDIDHIFMQLIVSALEFVILVSHIDDLPI
jgi:hypothetical protein